MGTLQSVGFNLHNPFLGIDLTRLGGAGWEVGLLSALPPPGANPQHLRRAALAGDPGQS